MRQIYIIFDCETGGLDSSKSPITQFACLVFSSEFEILTEFDTLVKPYKKDVEEKALKYSHLTLKQLNDEGIENNELFEIIRTVLIETKIGRKKPILCGHNVGFDISFLKELFKVNKSKLSDYVYASNDEIATIDTMFMSPLKFDKTFDDKDGGSHSLSNLCERIGFDIKNAHNAKFDVLATYEAIKFFFNNNEKTIKNEKQEPDKRRFEF